MIIVFIKSLAFPWFKQKVSCDHFKDHAGERPNISRRTIIHSNNCFWRPILTSLNLAWKMVMIPASITQITYFNLNVLINLWSSFKFKLWCVYISLLWFFYFFSSLGYYWPWIRLLLSMFFPFLLKLFVQFS